ncbi:MAG: acylphosphatase [Anaerolineales bacterium]
MTGQTSSSPSTNPEGATQRLVALVHGAVQGVGFRHACEVQARALGLRGYVRNRYDRTVEVVAEGARPQLEQLLSWLNEGPSIAHVSAVEVSWLAANGEFRRFEVRS